MLTGLLHWPTWASPTPLVMVIKSWFVPVGATVKNGAVCVRPLAAKSKNPAMMNARGKTWFNLRETLCHIFIVFISFIQRLNPDCMMFNPGLSDSKQIQILFSRYMYRSFQAPKSDVICRGNFQERMEANPDLRRECAPGTRAQAFDAG